MRLLGLTVWTICLFLTSVASADEICSLDKNSNEDILKCVSLAYKKTDKKLNEQYNSLISDPSFMNKRLLLEGQRAWIKYRDFNCQYRYNSISPGREADIERLACLTSSTSSRLIELFHFDTGSSGDGFYKSISFMSTYLNNTRESILAHFESMEHHPTEIEYFKKNCELTKLIFLEKKRACLARMKFQEI